MNIPIEPYLNMTTLLEIGPGALFIAGGYMVKGASTTLLDDCRCPHLPACPQIEDLPNYHAWSLNWGAKMQRAEVCRRIGCKHHAYCYKVAHIEPYLVPPLHKDCYHLRDGESPDEIAKDWAYDQQEQEWVSTRTTSRIKMPMRKNPEFERVAYYPLIKSVQVGKTFRSPAASDDADKPSAPSSPPARGRGRPRKYPVSN